MRKHSFYKLVEYIPGDEIDSEVKEKLDAIVQIAKAATPAFPNP